MHGGDGLDRASKIGVLPPEDDNPMITQHTQFLRRAEGNRTAADNDHQGIVRLGHAGLLSYPGR